MRLRTTIAKWPPSLAALAAAAAVTTLLAVTALASRQPLSGVGEALPAAGAGRSQINAPPWALVLAGTGVSVALLGILVSGRWRLPRRHKDEHPPRRVIMNPRVAKLLALVAPVILGAVLFAAAVAGSHSRTVIVPPKGKIGVPTGAPPSPRGSTYNAPTWILPAIVGVILGAAGAILLAEGLRRRLGQPRDGAGAAAEAEQLQALVVASLEDLRSEPDPRRAVIAAYRRLESALADVGLPRRAWEAPREYSGRARVNLELSEAPLRELTSLFERARFGAGVVGEPLRERAIDALSALRDELSGMARQETLA